MRHNARTLLAALERRTAVGGRQGERVRPRRDRRRRGGARRGRVGVVRRHRRRGRSRCAATSRPRASSSWARPATARWDRHATPRLELVVGDGRGPRRRARPREARHRNGPLGRLRAGVAGARGRRPHESPRDRRHGRRVRRVADRALSQRDRPLYASRAPHRQQRGCAALSVLRLRRCPLRHRAATACRRSAPTPPRTACGPCSDGRATSRRRSSCVPARAPATAGASSPSATRGSASSPSATPTASAAT